jgi:hypothetical protein
MFTILAQDDVPALLEVMNAENRWVQATPCLDLSRDRCKGYTLRDLAWYPRCFGLSAKRIAKQLSSAAEAAARERGSEREVLAAISRCTVIFLFIFIIAVTLPGRHRLRSLEHCRAEFTLQTAFHKYVFWSNNLPIGIELIECIDFVSGPLSSCHVECPIPVFSRRACKHRRLTCHLT